MGFSDPAAALANLHALTPTPREAELLAPALAAAAGRAGGLAGSRHGAQQPRALRRQVVDRAGVPAALAAHPGAAPAAGAPRRHEPVPRRRAAAAPDGSCRGCSSRATMRRWFAEELRGGSGRERSAVPGREARMNALRRFKYRHLLRIGCRDLLGDADLAVTTEELSHLADACLGGGLAMGGGRSLTGALRRAARRRRDADDGLAVIGMGKLGGDELNYSSDIDLIVRLRRRRRDRGRPRRADRQRRVLRRGGRGSSRTRSRRSPRRATSSASICACGPRGGWARSSSRSTAIAPTIADARPSSGSARR